MSLVIRAAFKALIAIIIDLIDLAITAVIALPANSSVGLQLNVQQVAEYGHCSDYLSQASILNEVAQAAMLKLNYLENYCLYSTLFKIQMTYFD